MVNVFGLLKAIPFDSQHVAWGGVHYTTLHRTLKIMHLGSLKSLRAVLFCGGNRQLDLVRLVCGVVNTCNICELRTGGVWLLNLGQPVNMGTMWSVSFSFSLCSGPHLYSTIWLVS